MSKPDKSASGGKRKLHRGQLGYLIVASGLVLILGCTAAFSFYYRGRILPRSEVSGIKLGGLTQAEAVLRLTEQTDSYKNATLTLV
ncbi:MAG: hypothetical protein WCG94_08925, partial [Methanothrix sp.]